VTWTLKVVILKIVLPRRDKNKLEFVLLIVKITVTTRSPYLILNVDTLSVFVK